MTSQNSIHAVYQSIFGEGVNLDEKWGQAELKEVLERGLNVVVGPINLPFDDAKKIADEVKYHCQVIDRFMVFTKMGVPVTQSEQPLVSIVIVNYNHPEFIAVCLRSLTITTGVPYEVIVVDNGSEPETVGVLRVFQKEGYIRKLVEEKENHYFSEGNNIGVRNSDPAAEYVLLLNSDVGILREDWLSKTLAWMNGTAVHWPSIWGLKPTQPSSTPKDIISVGWSHDATVIPSLARPEGFCCLIRKSVWKDFSPDFPWLYGIDEALTNMIRAGAKCGVLSQYGTYLVHREGASSDKIRTNPPMNKRAPDIPGWYRGLYIETLDFTLGPDEHSSYLWW